MGCRHYCAWIIGTADIVDEEGEYHWHCPQCGESSEEVGTIRQAEELLELAMAANRLTKTVN